MKVKINKKAFVWEQSKVLVLQTSESPGELFKPFLSFLIEEQLPVEKNLEKFEFSFPKPYTF